MNTNPDSKKFKLKAKQNRQTTGDVVQTLCKHIYIATMGWGQNGYMNKIKNTKRQNPSKDIKKRFEFRPTYDNKRVPTSRTNKRI
jgi:hypothetical protein